MTLINKNELSSIVNDGLTGLVHEMPQGLKDCISECLGDEVFPYFSGGFQFRIVLDTNILFSAVRHSVLKNTSTLLEKIANNPHIKIYGPVHLELEIFEKIEKKFPQKQHAAAQQVARRILDKIEILDKYSDSSMKKAQMELSKRDIKDVPFLSLAFDVRAAGILTNDRDFENSSAKIWNIRDTGEVVTILSKGSLSFIIAAKSMEILASIAIDIASVIWKKMVFLVNQIVSWVTSGSKIVAKHPFIILMVAAGLLWLDSATGCISRLTGKLVDVFREAGEALWQVIQFLAEIAGVGIEFYTILFENHTHACNTMEKLQQS